MLPRTHDGPRGPHGRGRQQSSWPRSKPRAAMHRRPDISKLYSELLLHGPGCLKSTFSSAYRSGTNLGSCALPAGVALGSAMGLCFGVLFLTQRMLLVPPSGSPTPPASPGKTRTSIPQAFVVGGSAAYQADLTMLHRLLPLTNFSALNSADILDAQAGILQHSELQQLMQLQQNLFCS
jgi:hypothetical protein